MGRISVIPVEKRSRMTIEEARWAAFLTRSGIPYQYKPLQFTEADTGPMLNQHTPSFLLQYEQPLWLEVLPAISTAALEAYDEVLHFARTILVIEDQEQSDYWPVSVDCIFVAFGHPGLPQGPYVGTYPVFVLGSDENPKPVIGGPNLMYTWAECRFCHRLTLCMDFGETLGDWTGSVGMSCCGRAFDDRDPATRPIRNSQRLRRAIAAADRIGAS
jgi:hypothetical protein